MSPQDLFLKINIDAYYPLEGKSIQQKTIKFENNDVVEYYIDGKKDDPDIRLYPDKEIVNKCTPYKDMVNMKMELTDI